MKRSAGPDDATVTLAAPGWFSALERIATALERIADSVELGMDPPGLAPAGPLILVDKGARLGFSMSSIPNDKDAIQHFAPGSYDGPIQGRVVDGDTLVSEVRPETPDGLAQRIVTVPGALGMVSVEYSADKRHGGDVAETTITVDYELVGPDEPNLQTRDVDIVDKTT
jgi:hypothetical protein